MPIATKRELFNLIDSLTKGEKRNFTLFVQRSSKEELPMFNKLFELIDKFPEKEDAWYAQKMNIEAKQNYSNLKRHLYKQIIMSLRILHNTKRANIQVREYIDYAFILYGKGLYPQASKILKLAKREAVKHHLNNSHYTIVEFQKMIESRHITRHGPDQAVELIEESTLIAENLNSTMKASNLRLEIHAYFIKNGHVKNEEESAYFSAQFENAVRELESATGGLNQRVFALQAKVWYFYTLNRFNESYEYANDWVDLFDRFPELIQRDKDLYLRGFHYMLNSAYHLRNVEKHSIVLSRLESYRKMEYKSLNRNSQIVSFLYVHTGRLNNSILKKDVSTGLLNIPKTMRRINKYSSVLDEHRKQVFYFKIAWIYLMADHIKKSISYLNKIVHVHKTTLRSDLKVYAIIMFMMCHYSSKNLSAIEYIIRTFGKDLNDLNRAQSLAIQMFKDIVEAPLLGHRLIFKQALENLARLKNDPYQKLSVNYLDVELWIKSKISNRTIAQLGQ
ncbi:MAG: hypothetical protein AAF487_02855 [Bacteroidota bacterium]